MARRRRVSSRNEAGTVSFFASGKGIAVAKRKSVVFVGKSPGKRKKITFTARSSDSKTPVRKVSFYSPSLKVLRKRALLKREIVKEVALSIFEKYYKPYANEDCDIVDLWEEEIKKEVVRAARLAIELWEKRR